MRPWVLGTYGQIFVCGAVSHRQPGQEAEVAMSQQLHRTTLEGCAAHRGISLVEDARDVWYYLSLHLHQRAVVALRPNCLGAAIPEICACSGQLMMNLTIH